MWLIHVAASFLLLGLTIAAPTEPQSIDILGAGLASSTNPEPKPANPIIGTAWSVVDGLTTDAYGDIIYHPATGGKTRRNIITALESSVELVRRSTGSIKSELPDSAKPAKKGSPRSIIKHTPGDVTNPNLAEGIDVAEDAAPQHRLSASDDGYEACNTTPCIQEEGPSDDGEVDPC